MALLPEKLLTPEEEELQRKKASLAELEAQLGDRELELASFLADLVHFEKRYLQTVGRRYAILDELRARIAEARARQNPNQQDAQEKARQTRAKAQESARAVGEEKPGEPSSDASPSASKPNRSESLRSLYRQAAKLLHPGGNGFEPLFHLAILRITRTRSVPGPSPGTFSGEACHSRRIVRIRSSSPRA